jgi:xylan 1,4-beta-xylosidase
MPLAMPIWFNCKMARGGWLSLGIRPKGGKFHHLGRETFLAPVSWTDDGWPIAGDNGIMLEEFKAPNLPEHKWEKEPVRDDFSSQTLGLQWNFLRNPYDADWSLTEKPGYLRLNGSRVSLKEKDSPAFVGRRQADFNMVASTQLSFMPATENEEAGLVVRGNDANHFSLVITQRKGEQVVLFRKYLQDKIESEEYKEIPKGDVVLRISSTELEYKFWVQPNGKKAILVGTAACKDISTEKIHGFIGAYIGMYASGNGIANTNPADFDWFDYEAEPKATYSWSIKIISES